MEDAAKSLVERYPNDYSNRFEYGRLLFKKGNVDAAIEHAKTRGEWELGVAEESDLRYLSGTKDDM